MNTVFVYANQYFQNVAKRIVNILFIYYKLNLIVHFIKIEHVSIDKILNCLLNKVLFEL